MDPSLGQTPHYLEELLPGEKVVVDFVFPRLPVGGVGLCATQHLRQVSHQTTSSRVAFATKNYSSVIAFRV